MNIKLDNLNQLIGARIRIEREARHWSLSDLAEQAGVSRAMVHKIERGESSPTAMLLGRLAGAFGLSMSKLIARAETQEGRLLRGKISRSGSIRRAATCGATFRRAPICRSIWCVSNCRPARRSRCRPRCMPSSAS